MQVTQRYIALALIALALNVIWERVHMPLYSSYEALGQGWTLIAWVGLGDAMYTLCIACAIAAWKRDLNWLHRAGPLEYVSAGVLGLLTAIFIEYKAMLLHRWSYSAGMPILPYLNLGLSPLLQLSLLVPLSVYLTKRYSQISGLQEREN